MAYLSETELQKIGFASVGKEVFISDKASFYNPSKISIGSFVRIDDFCLLSAGDEGIEIGDYIHLSCYVCLLGQGKIKLCDFVSISIKATIISSTSDFSGESIPELRGFSTLEESVTSIISSPVTFETHTGMGAHSLVLPGVTVKTGSVVGAMSVVYESLNPWGIYIGNPARFVKKRSDKAFKIIEEIRNKEQKL